MSDRKYLVTDEVRAEIETRIHAGMGRNEIARELGIAGAYVTGVAQGMGHSWVAAAQNEAGRQTRLERIAAAKERLEEALFAEAEASLADMHAPAELHHYQSATEFDSGGWHSLTLPEPTFQDRRALMTVVGIAVQRATELGKASTAGDATDTGRGVIDSLADGLEGFADHLRKSGVNPTETPAEDTDPTQLLADLEASDRREDDQE